jgi:hypothetical protein
VLIQTHETTKPSDDCNPLGLPLEIEDWEDPDERNPDRT